MSDHQLSIPDSVYQHLLAAAAIEGITPVDWIATHLPVAALGCCQEGEEGCRAQG